MPPSYVSRATLARELEISESAVDGMARRGVLPRPIKLSAGCVRWRWAEVDMALMSLGDVRNDAAANEALRIRLAAEASKCRMPAFRHRTPAEMKAVQEAGLAEIAALRASLRKGRDR